MRKNFFLTLMLTLLCTAAGWAQFSPERGKMYAFREVTSGLFLDIQTLGINEPGHTTNSISLNAKPCIIYFEDVNGKYTMKNVNGTYAQQASGDRHRNVVIGTTAYEWAIADSDSDGAYTIARTDGKFIKMDNATNGAPLYCDKDTGLEFALVEYSDLLGTPVKLKHSGKELYMNCTEPNNVQFKEETEATQLYIFSSASASIIKIKGIEEPANYLAHIPVAWDIWDNWSITAASPEPYLWLVSDADDNGAVSISKFSNNGHRLGSDENDVSVGTGIWPNVGEDCNKWMIESSVEYAVPTFTDNDINDIKNNGQYLTKLAINGMCVYTSSAAPSTAANMYVETPVTGISLERGVEHTMNLTFPKNQTNQILVANMWIDKDGDGTFETHLGTTGTEKSNSNDISTVMFTIPADAAQGLTRIRLRLDSSWSIAEDPNADANRMVYDIPVAITVAQPYTFYIDNPSDHAVNVKYNGEPILGGAKIPADVDTDLFTVPEIEGYTWEIVINNQNKSVTLVYVKKYSLHLIDAPLGVTITYDGNAITEGFYFENEFDSQKLQVSCPDGYSWELSKDTEGKFVVVTFTALVRVENPEAVVALIKRIGGDGIENKFKFILDPSLDSNNEVFVIAGEGHKVVIKGTTISAITTGIGWYLNNYAYINIAWNSLNEKTASGAAYADLSNIPVPTAEERRTSDAKYRYYLNYCTFGYSMTTWTWKRWQQEIDWMALHGINMPLQIIGLEEVWRKFLTLEENGKRKYNYSNEEAKAFVPGPAFTAWWGMNNLEGWGGTAADGWGGVQDDAWYARQKALAKQICDRQRELGMQPVLPGFSGMVPTNFQTKTGVACDAGKWCSFDRPKIVLPSNERFAEIAADYYACLEAVMGESQYYSIDPFHEGGSINGGTEQQYKDAYKAIYNAMENAKPGSQWVIQQWQWNHNNFQKLSLTAVPAGRLIVLDLFSDGRPEFDLYSGYDPQEAVFCAVPNFGGRSGLMGRLQNVTDNYFSYKEKYPTSIKGIAAAPEAIEQTPVAYDLVFQLPWMGSKPNVKEWVKNYATARYGVENAEAQAAWDLLRQGPLNYGADAIQGPVEDVWAARPNLDANAASTWGSTLSKKHGSNVRPDATYTKERQQMLIEATYKLLAQNGAITGDINVSNYNYDIVELGGAVMADYAHYLLLGIKAAKEAAGDAFATDAKYIARRDAFLALIADVDNFKGTNLNFRLGKWTQEARDAAAEAVALGATSANADWYEYNNARTLITTWGDYAQNNSGGLRDYSYRSWQGLLKDYYLPRWEYYFNNGCTHPGNNVQNYFYFEWNWAHGLEHNVGNTSKSSTKLAQGKPGYSYSREPQGNTVDVAKELLGKYIIPVTTGEATTYAYRHLTNDLRATCTLSVMEGNTVNLCDYFGELNYATITAECIDGTATDAKNVIIKSGAANGAATKYDAQITLADGTVIDFVLVVNDETFMVAKDELAALIEKMESLTAQVATYNPKGDKKGLSLSAENVFSNADIKEAGDKGISALFDDMPNTYIHTAWSGNTTDGKNHYLRVYLGDEPTLETFVFSYVTRNNDNTERPRQITVSGCNTPDGEYETIAVLTDLPNKKAHLYESAIYNATGYKYLRFMVDDTYRDLYDGNNHKAYSMAEFDLYKAASTADVYSHLEGVIKDEEAATAYDALVKAQFVYDNSMSQSEIDAAKTLLKEKYDALKELLGGNILPVKLTTDEANPVLYKIIIKRADDGSKVLRYDNNDNMVAVGANAENKTWQAWYFMSSANGVTIHPYNADGKVLSADNTSNGAGKVWAVEKGSKTFYEWKFVKRTDDEYYNIQATNDAYFSHFGGVNNKMGFWDGDANETKVQTDGGSLFKFIDAEFENGNARYYQLHDLVNGVIPTQSDAKLNQMASGTAPGYYDGNADEFREAYRAAKDLDTNGNTSPAADCYATYKALSEAYATNPTMIMPTDGAVYRIRNYIIRTSEKYQNHYVINNNVKIEFPTSYEESGAKALWVCVKDGEKYKFVSALGTATYVWQGIGETAYAFTLAAGIAPGALCMKDKDDKRLALTGEEWKNKDTALFNVSSSSEYNGGSDSNYQWSTDWYLEPVEKANVVFERDLNAGHHWGTLYLPYAVEVPYGITAYYAKGANVADKVVELEKVENDIIPAYTPVLINRADDSVTETFSFYYTAEKGTAVTGNLFGGRVIESAVECEENKNYYLLLNASKGEAFYWVYKEFGENGQITNPGTHNGGHILCEANKAFLAIEAGSENPAALSFRYDGDTTGIEEVKGENGKVKTIYDLQGRKLTEITKPGIYIVNGKKVLVK